MQDPRHLPDPDSDFDDLEELMDESTRTTKASEVEDLDDLDSLLEESTAIASAKKAKNQGRKLTLEQQEILQSNHLAAEANLWEGKEVYAHVAKTSCNCGHHFEDFRGWYQYQEQRRGGGRRLIRTDCHEGLPAARYVTEVTVAYCSVCSQSGLPDATAADCDLLEALGEQEVESVQQLVLFDQFGLVEGELEEASEEEELDDDDELEALDDELSPEDEADLAAELDKELAE